MNLCKCHHIPPEGTFIRGNTYCWTSIIDGIQVLDENDNKIDFDEIIFLWFFTKETKKSYQTSKI